VAFVGVAWSGSDDSFQGFIDKHDLTFPQISDDPGDVFERFDVAGQPAAAVVGRDGEVQLLLGAVEAEVLDDVINGMLDA
jgi:peroxiredoxin